MKIISSRTVGFQSFADSLRLRFDSGINVIVGQNNSGKSALLRSFRVPIQDDRHRNTERFETHHLAVPSIELELEVTGSEIKDAFLRRNNAMNIPMQNRPGLQFNNTSQIKPFTDRIFNAGSILFRVKNF